MAVVTPNALGLHLNRVPILKPLLALILGICTGYYADWFSLNLVAFIILILVVLQVLCFFYRSTRNGRVLFPIVFYLLWLFIGVWSVNRLSPMHEKTHFSNYEPNSYIVLITKEPINKVGYVRFIADVKYVVQGSNIQACKGKLVVTIAEDAITKGGFVYGDVLHIKNTVRLVEAPYNPYEFDYKEYLRSKDIFHQCFLSFNEVIKLSEQQGDLMVDKALRYRKLMLHKFSQSIQNQQSLQLVMALIFGYRSEIDEDTVDVFRSTGTVHILSVSGLHVGLLFAFLMFLFSWMNRVPYGRYFKLALIMLSIWFYVLLTGMSPPILRAGIMISFFIIALAMNRKQVSLNTLFASALCILVHSPKSLFDIGFQLSYAAVLGILLLYPLLLKLYNPQNKYWRIIINYSYISIAAQLFTLPLILFYFGQFPTYFIPANLFIALPSTGIMYLGVLLAVNPFTYLNDYLGVFLEGVLGSSVKGLKLLKDLPAAVISDLYWNKTQVVLAFIMLFLLIWAWNYRAKKAAFVCLSLLIFFSVFTSVACIKKQNYSGIRVYNVNNDWAIAVIQKGKTFLYSSLDSIRHKKNVYSVLPDLSRLGRVSDIAFKKVPQLDKQNFLLTVGERKVLVLEEFLNDSVGQVDLVLWRKNNGNKLEDVKDIVDKNSAVLVDGSNSDKTIETLKQHLPIYILKNNFAYVWDEE